MDHQEWHRSGGSDISDQLSSFLELAPRMVLGAWREVGFDLPGINWMK